MSFKGRVCIPASDCSKDLALGEVWWNPWQLSFQTNTKKVLKVHKILICGLESERFPVANKHKLYHLTAIYKCIQKRISMILNARSVPPIVFGLRILARGKGRNRLIK